MEYLFVIQIPITFKNGAFWMPQLAAIDLLAHQRLLPQEVQLIVTAPLKDNLNEPLEPLNGVKVLPLKFENSFGEGFSAFLPNWTTLWREIERTDFVHTGCGGWPFFFSPCFQAHLIALIQHKPRLFVMDCDLIGKIENNQIAHAPNWRKRLVWKAYARLTWQLFKFCLKTAGAGFLLGRGVVTRYGRYAKNSLEIYQPIVGQEDIIPEKQLLKKLVEIRSGQSLKAVFVGRLVYEKGVDIFLEAVEILNKKAISLKVEIIGDGPEGDHLKELAAKLGIEVAFCGALPWGEKIFEKLRESHFFVVTHLTEEMTRTALEGSASGCALVCSNTVALQQLVNASKGGAIFKRGNAESLASILSALLSEREKLAGLVKNGVDFFKKNHRDAHIQRRLDFLEKTFNELNWR